MATYIFGYGSLLFKPIPHLANSIEVPRAGYIKAHVRRFAQDSHDHRGTLENAGRVVTLVSREDWLPFQRDEPDEESIVWGVIYTIPEAEPIAGEIWNYLDIREADGYTKRTIDVFSRDKQDREILIQADVQVYVGATENESFGRAVSMDELAHIIAFARGPSGLNRDYLYALVNALRLLAPGTEDIYLNRLEQLVRRKVAESSPTAVILPLALDSPASRRIVVGA